MHAVAMSVWFFLPEGSACVCSAASVFIPNGLLHLLRYLKGTFPRDQQAAAGHFIRGRRIS